MTTWGFLTRGSAIPGDCLSTVICASLSNHVPEGGGGTSNQNGAEEDVLRMGPKEAQYDEVKSTEGVKGKDGSITKGEERKGQ